MYLSPKSDVEPISMFLAMLLMSTASLAGIGCDEDSASPRGDAGEIAGEMAGEIAGQAGGEMIGGIAGDIAGDDSGEDAGDDVGEPHVDPTPCLRLDVPCVVSAWGGIRSAEGVWAERDLRPRWGAPQTQTLAPAGSDSGGEVLLRTLSLTAPASSAALEVSWRGLHADRALQVGHQSWSFSGPVTIPSAVPRDDEGHLLAKEGRTGDSFFAEHGVSFSLIGGRVGPEVDADGAPLEGAGHAWLVGALNAEEAFSVFAIERDEEAQADEEASSATRVSLRVGLGDVPLGGESLDDLILSPAEARSPRDDDVAVELLWVSAPTMWLAQRAFQERALAYFAARLERQESDGVDSKRKLTPHRPPSGWFSWNEHFEDIDEALIDQHIDLTAALLAPQGLTLVEVDDGWQQGWGLWEENEKFPNGLGVLAERADSEGLAFGVWMAPFLVEEEVAALYDEAVFVHQGGAPLRHRVVGNPRTYFVLDATHPSAMDIVTEPLRRLSEQGVTFFKLDFLYAGGLPGARARAVTGAEALHYGMTLIREAIGERAVINGCGAPIHAMWGYVDSLRVGADTTFGELIPSFIAAAARNLASRAYLSSVLWPDGDQVQLREPYHEDEARVGAYVAALAGPAYGIGDNLERLPDMRREVGLDAELMRWVNVDAPARPIDLMSQPAAQIYPNPLADSAQNAGLTGAPPPTLFEVIDASGQRLRARFDWSGPRFSVEITTRD